MKHSIFGHGHTPRPRIHAELGTVSEELLAETDGTVAVSDIETAIRPVKDKVPQQNNAGSAECKACIAPHPAPLAHPDPKPPGIEPQGRSPLPDSNRASHGGRETRQHSMAMEHTHSGRQSGAAQHRRSASVFSRQPNKLSRLVRIVLLPFLSVLVLLEASRIDERLELLFTLGAGPGSCSSGRRSSRGPAR